MLRDLPEFVQDQVLYYLESNNFSAAKSLHDAWMRHGSNKARYDATKNTDVRDVSKNFMRERQVMLAENILNAE